MVENLKIEGIKDYPIKWICNFRGQKAIGICGYSQKIAMFAASHPVFPAADPAVQIVPPYHFLSH